MSSSASGFLALGFFFFLREKSTSVPESRQGVNEERRLEEQRLYQCHHRRRPCVCACEAWLTGEMRTFAKRASTSNTTSVQKSISPLRSCVRKLSSRGWSSSLATGAAEASVAASAVTAGLPSTSGCVSASVTKQSVGSWCECLSSASYRLPWPRAPSSSSFSFSWSGQSPGCPQSQELPP